jgi:hypothetical protein
MKTLRNEIRAVTDYYNIRKYLRNWHLTYSDQIDLAF